MKKKRHRTVDSVKARAAAGGGSFYDRIIPSQTLLAACSRCGTRTTLIGLDGECLCCRLGRRKEVRGAEAVPFPAEGSSA